MGDVEAPLLTLPQSDFSNVTGGTDFAPAVTSMWPVCATSGWALLGELDKYVPTSPQRFGNVSCTPQGMHATVFGSAGERVAITLLRPGDGGRAAAVVHTIEVTIPASGTSAVEFRTYKGLFLISEDCQ